MKRLTRPEGFPRLFYGADLGVEAFYRLYDTPEKVMRGEINQGYDVEKGIEAFLKCDLTIERLIIEGIAIAPESALSIQRNFPNIKFEITFLFDDDVERITRRIHERGLWGPKDSYPDYIKDIEVDWVVLYNDFYATEAKKHKLPLVHIDSLQSE